jgi:DeoR family transcriptional regulator, glycerol-3-phosphate regulon repressor
LSDIENFSAVVATRREAIVRLVEQRGFMTVEALVQHFAVTPQTIRRDVNALDDEGRLRRYHGGAGPASSSENIGHRRRQILHLMEKQSIAREVAARIPAGASLFINIGTTNEEIARALVKHKGLRIITNNLAVAMQLFNAEGCEVTIAGGLVRSADGGVVGEATIDLINQFKVDYGIIGISGIDADGTLLDYDYREVRVAQAIMRNARRVLLAADHSKFGRPAMVRLGSITQVSVFFTDRPPPETIQRLLHDADVELCLPREHGGAYGAATADGRD